MSQPICQDLRLKPRLEQAAHAVQLAWRKVFQLVGKDDLEDNGVLNGGSL